MPTSPAKELVGTGWNTILIEAIGHIRRKVFITHGTGRDVFGTWLSFSISLPNFDGKWTNTVATVLEELDDQGFRQSNMTLSHPTSTKLAVEKGI